MSAATCGMVLPVAKTRISLRSSGLRFKLPHRSRQPERDLREDHQQHGRGHEGEHKDARPLVDLHEIDACGGAYNEGDEPDRRVNEVQLALQHPTLADTSCDGATTAV